MPNYVKERQMIMTIDAEHIVSEISGMDKHSLKNAILHFEGRFKLDFTDDFLDRLSLEQLRHILLAAKMQLLNSPPN